MSRSKVAKILVFVSGLIFLITGSFFVHDLYSGIYYNHIPTINIFSLTMVVCLIPGGLGAMYAFFSMKTNWAQYDQ